MDNLWGKLGSEDAIRVHFDPLQSYMIDDRPVGFRIHIVAARQRRPRETGKIKPRAGIMDNKGSILEAITRGEEESIPIAVDDQIIGSPTDDARLYDFTKYDGVSIVNKYSPLGTHHKQAGGVAMVSFYTKPQQTLDDPWANYSILRPLKYSCKALLEDKLYRDDLQTALTFFNIGTSSGASLIQLHGQTYCTQNAHGILTQAFNSSFAESSKCIACQLGNSDIVVDSIGQHISVEDHTIWEDEYMRLIVPYAPVRPFTMRIIPKIHTNYLGAMPDDALQSLGKALTYAHQIIYQITPRGWSIEIDRTVAFRQSTSYLQDFHMFVDVLPTIPLGGAEVIDSLSVTSIDPIHSVQYAKQAMIDILQTGGNAQDQE